MADDFFGRLVRHSRGTATVIQPLSGSRFAPPASRPLPNEPQLAFALHEFGPLSSPDLAPQPPLVPQEAWTRPLPSLRQMAFSMADSTPITPAQDNDPDYAIAAEQDGLHPAASVDAARPQTSTGPLTPEQTADDSEPAAEAHAEHPERMQLVADATDQQSGEGNNITSAPSGQDESRAGVQPSARASLASDKSEPILAASASLRPPSQTDNRPEDAPPTQVSNKPTPLPTSPEQVTVATEEPTQDPPQINETTEPPKALVQPHPPSQPAVEPARTVRPTTAGPESTIAPKPGQDAAADVLTPPKRTPSPESVIQRREATLPADPDGSKNVLSETTIQAAKDQPHPAQSAVQPADSQHLSTETTPLAIIRPREGEPATPLAESGKNPKEPTAGFESAAVEPVEYAPASHPTRHPAQYEETETAPVADKPQRQGEAEQQTVVQAASQSISSPISSSIAPPEPLVQQRAAVERAVVEPTVVEPAGLDRSKNSLSQTKPQAVKVLPQTKPQASTSDIQPADRQHLPSKTTPQVGAGAAAAEPATATPRVGQTVMNEADNAVTPAAKSALKPNAPDAPNSSTQPASKPVAAPAQPDAKSAASADNIVQRRTAMPSPVKAPVKAPVAESTRSAAPAASQQQRVAADAAVRPRALEQTPVADIMPQPNRTDFAGEVSRPVASPNVHTRRPQTRDHDSQSRSNEQSMAMSALHAPEQMDLPETELLVPAATRPRDIQDTSIQPAATMEATRRSDSSRSEPSQSDPSRPATARPTIRVTIGRVDVYSKPSPPTPSIQRPKPVQPSLSLDIYLKGGSG